ncbi:hypothetical protein [Streptomyces sp. NPDC001070]
MNEDAKLPLINPERVFFQKSEQSGSATLAKIAKLDPGALQMGISCSGKGSIEVKVEPVIEYRVVCGSNSPQYNEYGMKHPRKNVSVSVVSHTPGIWSFSLGWTSKLPDSPG